METKTITAIYHNSEDQQGNKYIGKNGKPYIRVNLKLDGEAFYRSGYGNCISESWENGQKLVVNKDIELSTQGKYHNFKALDPRNYKEPVDNTIDHPNEYEKYPTNKNTTEVQQIIKLLAEANSHLSAIAKNFNTEQYDEAGNKLPFHSN